MSDPAKALLNAQRKLYLQLHIRAQREAIRYNINALRPTTPVKRLWTLSPSMLKPKKTPASIFSTLAISLLTKRMGMLGKILRLGVTLYPFVMGTQKRKSQ